MHDRILEETAAPGPLRQFLEKSRRNPMFDEERLDAEFRTRYRAMQARIRARLAARRMAAAENRRPTGVTGGLPGTRKMLVLGVNGNDGQMGLFEAETGEFIRTIAPLASGLAGPTDLAMGADGHVYIANKARHNILRYNGQTFERLPGPLGAAGTAEFVPAGSVGLARPSGLAFGRDGNLYVSTPGLDAVYRFAGPSAEGDCAGLIPGAPCPGPLAAEGTAEFVPAGTAGLAGGRHLTIGADGNLYVTHYDGKILRFDGSTGEFIDEFASVCDGPAPTEDNCESALELTHPGGDAQHEIVRDFDLRCATPSGVPADELFHRDVWYRYRAPCDGSLTVDTCEVRGLGDTVLAIHDGGATGSCPTDVSTRLNPFVDVDSCPNAFGPERQELQVLEGGWYLLRIGVPPYGHGTGTLRVAITCDGTAAADVPSAPLVDVAAEEDECDLVLMNGPDNVRFGPDGNLYVASEYDNRILRFDGATGALIDQVICPGLGDSRIDTIAFGPDGRLYVGDWWGLVWRYDLEAGASGELFIDTNQLPFPYIVWGVLVLPLCGDGVCEVGEHLCNCPDDCPPPPGFEDCNANGVPDECEPDEDCNANGGRDICDIGAGTSDDCNANLMPDECEPDEDCNGNGIQDICDLVGPIGDCNSNGIPDDCEDDCNANSVPDDCDIASGGSGDCNANAIPDDCDIASSASPDVDQTGVPDECEGAVLYVDSNAAGGNNGTSWADAYTGLQDALATAYGAADVVTEIRVAGGTYKPDRGTRDRTRSFAMRSGLQILGGFAGNAAEEPDERDVARFETVLSGDLAGDDILVEPGAGGGEPDDSCANAGPIYTGDTPFDTTYATTDGPNPVVCEYGPAPLGADIWYVYTHTCPTTHVRISVCETEKAPFFFDPFIAVYEGNTCPGGDHLACNDDYCAWGSRLEFEAEPGGKYLLRVGGWNGRAGRGVINVRCVQYAEVPGKYAPTYVSLINMEENSYQVVVAEAVDASAVIDGFTITGGMANGESQVFGGGIAITEARPTVRNCRFVHNTAGFVGGGMWQSGYGAEYGTGSTFIDCAFVANTAWVLAAAASDTSATFHNCIFAQNETNSGFTAGGGFFSNCTFRENMNMTDLGGGCINGPAVIEHCLFERNVANRGGAIMNQFGETFEVSDSLFIKNRAYLHGGAIRHRPDPVGLTIRNSLFLNNQTNYYGGAIYNLFEDARLDITNSILAGNTSVVAGGAISQIFAGVTMLDHVTLKDNSALYQDVDFGSGGGIHAFGGTVNVSNSILWGNNDELGTGLDSQIGSVFADVNLEHSCVQGLEAGPDGEGNIGRNPLLTPDGHLRTGSPCIDAGDPDYVPDPASPLDIDGDLRVVGGHPDMGADEFSDLDLDRLPDWWELKHFHSTVAAVAGEDSDNDGLTNRDEYERYGSNPITSPYYVSGTAGRNANDGLSPDPAGHGVGPKRTIQAALDVAGDGDTVVVAGQHQPYDGLGNFELDFDGKSVVVRSADGATIDCAGAGRAVNHFSLGAASATVEGFNLYDCTGDVGGAVRQAQSRLQMRDCVLESCRAQFAAGGIFLTRSNPTFSYLSLGSNWAPFVDAGIIENASVSLEGPLEIERGTLEVWSSWFEGPGHLQLGPDAVMVISGPSANSPTVLRSDLFGLGNVQIDQELWVEEDAVVDLSGGTGAGSCADPALAEFWGTVFVEGSLFVRDATIRNTNVQVKIADFEDDTEIINNDITLLDASAGFGGQFFVDGTAVVQCNTIVSEGDRYLDLDPDPLAEPRPLIQDNRFFVLITQGAEGEQGEIFDLRIQDFDCIGDCPSGAFEVPASTGYDDEWALEELTLLPETKLNLTNRQGMVFQDPTIPTPETLYVKDLILGSGATLNTAFERLYYQRLTDEFGAKLIRDPENPTAPLANGSRIVDIPLLGFSLGIIAMNDDTEFGVRVRTRTTDPDDTNPEDPFAELPRGRVRRIHGLEPNPDDGHLELDTREASSVSAKGAFARATEDSIIVSFQYLFRGNPGAELVVYLSDDPDVSENLIEVARVYPPPDGRRGAINDNDEFATFHGSFPKGDLNFIRGTYVELELRNAGSRVWIDEWDPVICSAVCGSFSGNDFALLGHVDYLYLLSDYGRQVRGNDQECADSPLNGDGYVGLGDLLAWELYYDTNAGFNLCGDGTTASGAVSATPADVPAGTVLIAGKRTEGSQDALYTLDANGNCTGDQLSPASTPGLNGYRANGRVIRDAFGTLYQLHSRQGLIQLSDAQVVIPPSGEPAAFGDKQVLVGTWPSNGGPRGVPIQDVAFQPTDDSVVYVAPVLVEPPGADPYRTAARLRLTDGPEHVVIEQLYGQQPVNGDGCCNTDPCSASECSVNHPREIEVAGGRVFVTSSRVNGDDWLLVFDESTGAEQTRIRLAVPSPTALTLSSTGQIYLASSMEDEDPTGSELYRYTLDETGEDAALVHESMIRIDHMRQITAVAKNPNDGSLWVIGFDAPDFDDYDVFYDDDPLFTTPMLAMVADGATTAAATEITCHDLALPLSALFTTCVASGDAEPDGDIDLRDFAAFQQCMTGPGGDHGGSPCTVLDTDCDGDVDQLDYKFIRNRLTGPWQ